MSKKTDTLAIARNSTSKDFQKLNPDVFGVAIPVSDGGPWKQTTPKKSGKRRKEMNKTEFEFARILDARVSRGELNDWAYEEITLRWPDGMRFTPDFVVWGLRGKSPAGLAVQWPITLIEIKGSRYWHGQDKSIVKFRAARDKWGDRFKFEFYQKIDGEWRETR